MSTSHVDFSFAPDMARIKPRSGSEIRFLGLAVGDGRLRSWPRQMFTCATNSAKPNPDVPGLVTQRSATGARSRGVRKKNQGWVYPYSQRGRSTIRDIRHAPYRQSKNGSSITCRPSLHLRSYRPRRRCFRGSTSSISCRLRSGTRAVSPASSSAAKVTSSDLATPEKT